ncbi:MAG: DUF1989 domain-containing protein [Pseudomonadota bacterium]
MALAESQTSPVRPRLLLPGLARSKPGQEQYRVAGGGSVTVPVFAGDQIHIMDPEGRQACEVVAVTADGREAPGLLGADDGGPGHGLRQMVKAGGANGADLLAALEKRGLDLAFDRAIHCFGAETPAFETVAFTVDDDGLVIVAAPGEDMAVDAHDPATALELTIQRADPKRAAEATLPDPLADVRHEHRILAGTAHAFEVRAGEFIQIMDIEGRECSDFQAFATRQLDKGIERDIDPTATRTLMGAIYPGPGLFSKFYDTDLEPKLELIQDMVGRHDTFGFACTAKYYDDNGYPGHVNCTESFNNALAPYGIAPRGGWQAINFFYNTNIDDNHQLYLDDPWSRPGDHVIVRALEDMVCIASACPDDITAANGWNPTDIMARVYAPENVFKKAIAFRMTPDAEPEMTKETAFHARTSELTRNITEYNGYWLPTHYNNHGKVDEYWACREGVVALDLSPLRKFEVTGPDAEELMQRTLTRNVRKLAEGEVVYSAMCYEHGGMIDDGTLFRMSDTNFRWVGGSDYGGKWLREKAVEWGLRAWVKSSTDELHNFAVQGPKSRDLLRDVIWTPPTQPSMDEIAWFRFAIGRIGGHNGVPVVVSRTGYTGELGYEVWCHPKHGTEVWDAVWQAGEPHGLTPLGLDALDMLRIESGLIFAGYEFDDQTDPFEAGIGFTVALKHGEDFVGRDALVRRKENPQKKLVGLELEGGEAAGHGDCVHIGRPQIGVVTSGMKSPILKKNIALARLDVAHAEPGTEVEVGKLDGHQKRIPATVVPFPFYDPKKERPRS